MGWQMGDWKSAQLHTQQIWWEHASYCSLQVYHLIYWASIGGTEAESGIEDVRSAREMEISVKFWWCAKHVWSLIKARLSLFRKNQWHAGYFSILDLYGVLHMRGMSSIMLCGRTSCLQSREDRHKSKVAWKGILIKCHIFVMTQQMLFNS